MLGVRGLARELERVSGDASLRAAVRLGFSDSSALAAQFWRTAGECPMRLARRPWRVLLERALNDVTNRGRKGEEEEGAESP